MRRIPIPTRISSAAAAYLRRRAAQARVGPSSLASRLLEKALFDPAEASAVTPETAGDVPPRAVLEIIMAELLFNSSALERFIAKQPGLTEELRKEARIRASEILDVALGAKAKPAADARSTGTGTKEGGVAKRVR